MGKLKFAAVLLLAVVGTQCFGIDISFAAEATTSDGEDIAGLILLFFISLYFFSWC